MEEREGVVELPFTADEFFAMVAQYNLAIWPTQVAAYLLAICTLLLIVNNAPHADRLISGILAIFWLWTGLVFQLLYFRELSGGPALFFGVLMIWQAILLAVVGVVQHRLHFAAKPTPRRLVGATFIFYALYTYPLLSWLAGYHYPFAVFVGVAPCPTAIFTYGLLLWAEPKVPQCLLPILFVWSLFSFEAALSLGMVQDFALPFVALIGTILLVRGDHRKMPMKNAPQFHSPIEGPS